MHFSIVDMVDIPSECIDPQAYCRKLEQRLKVKGNKTLKNRLVLKMHASKVLQTNKNKEILRS